MPLRDPGPADAPTTKGARTVEPAKKRAGRKPVGYRDIAASLIERIRGGAWQVGDPLPSELELMDEFKAARATVREALRQLQELGYIRRHRGTRSVLTSLTAEATFVNSIRSAEELLHYSRRTHGKVLATDHLRIDDALARKLGCAGGSEWVRIGILRTSTRNRLPLCYSEIYIEPRYRDVVPHIRGEHTVYTVIEERHGVVFGRIEQEIEAAAADGNVASRLNIDEGSPLLLVRTRFFTSDDRMIEVGLTHFPAGRYRVRLEMTRRASPAHPER